MNGNDERYDLKPSKEAYQAVKSDVTPVSAFKELIDNALDNWTRVSQRLDDITVEIEHYEGGPNKDEKVVIRDDTGGVEEEDVRILFALGQSKKEQVTGSIGAYGIGAKKAIVNLGNTATIKSRYLHSETGYGFTIDEDWLRDDDDWSVDKEEHTDIGEGVTEIKITDLNIDWEDYVDDLETDLANTYEKFLAESYDEERGNLNIVIREYGSDDWESPAEITEIKTPEPIQWSFAPIDGFHPRRYENIKLESKEFEDTIYLDITVGLMRGSDSDISGADIYCQDRKVLTSVRDDRAAFGTGSGSNRLGNFSNQHHRLKVIIEFNTDGDASQLPWDAQKSDIDPYNRVAQAAYSWVRRIVKPYHQGAGSYTTLRTSFLRPYTRESEYAVTSDLDDPYDYSNRERVTHKPDTDFSTAKKLNTQARISQTLHIYAPDNLAEEYIPAFESELDRLFNKGEDEKDQVDIADLPRVEDLPALDEEEAEEIVDQLTAEARSHLRRELRATTLPGWQQVVYNQIVEQLLEEDERELTMDDLESLEGEEVSPVDTESVTLPEEGSEESASEEGSEESASEEGSEESASEEGPEDVVEDVAREVTEDVSGDEVTTEKVQATLEERIGDLTLATEDEGMRSISLPEEDWADLTDALGLDEDASEGEVREELLSTMDVLRQLRSTA